MGLQLLYLGYTWRRILSLTDQISGKLSDCSLPNPQSLSSPPLLNFPPDAFPCLKKLSMGKSKTESRPIPKESRLIKYALEKGTHSASGQPSSSSVPSSSNTKKPLPSRYFVDPKETLKPFNGICLKPSPLPPSRLVISGEGARLLGVGEKYNSKMRVSLIENTLADWEDTLRHGLKCRSLTSSFMDAIAGAMIVKPDPSDPLASSFQLQPEMDPRALQNFFSTSKALKASTKHLAVGYQRGILFLNYIIISGFKLCYGML